MLDYHHLSKLLRGLRFVNQKEQDFALIRHTNVQLKQQQKTTQCLCINISIYNNYIQFTFSTVDLSYNVLSTFAEV